MLENQKVRRALCGRESGVIPLKFRGTLYVVIPLMFRGTLYVVIFTDVSRDALRGDSTNVSRVVENFNRRNTHLMLYIVRK